MGLSRDLRAAVANVLDPILPGRVSAFEPEQLMAPYVFVGAITLQGVGDTTYAPSITCSVPIWLVYDGFTRAAQDTLDDLNDAAWDALTAANFLPTSSAPNAYPTGQVDAEGQPIQLPARVITVTARAA